MAASLGEVGLVEEGLPGRTTQHDDPVMGAFMNARPALRIALRSHAPLDRMVQMLGTNDCKARFQPSAERIAAGIAGLLDIAVSEEEAATSLEIWLEAAWQGEQLSVVITPTQ